MTRRILTLIAACALLGSSAAYAKAKPTKKKAPAPAVTHLDFGTLPEGWKMTKDPGSLAESSGYILMSEKFSSVVALIVKLHGPIKELVDQTLESDAMPSGVTYANLRKDADGEWTSDTEISVDDVVVEGFILFRELPRLEGYAVIFMGTAPPFADRTALAPAYGIAKATTAK